MIFHEFLILYPTVKARSIMVQLYPVNKVKEDLFVHEQYHGPTRAFKDMALQPFGSILSSIAKKRDEKYLILAATSGDTGPAALDTFKNKENIQIACMYPDGGTSDVQRLQMVCEDGKNQKVAIRLFAFGAQKRAWKRQKMTFSKCHSWVCQHL